MFQRKGGSTEKTSAEDDLAPPPSEGSEDVRLAERSEGCTAGCTAACTQHCLHSELPKQLQSRRYSSLYK